MGSSHPPNPLFDVAGLNAALLDAVTGRRQQVLAGVDLAVQPGEVVGLTGQSGGGKSTLALALAGLLPSSTRLACGRWSILGSDLATGAIARLGGGSAARIERFVRRVPATSLFFISQDARSSLVPYRTVAWHLKQASRAARRASRPEDDVRLLEQVGFAGGSAFLGKYPREMASGECQRIQFAMALRIAPRLLIADEPFASVDQSLARDLGRQLRATTADGGGILLISHDLGLLREAADRVAVIRKGRLIESGAARDVLDPGRPHSSHTSDLLRAAGGAPYQVSPAAAAQVEAAPGRVLIATHSLRKTFRRRSADGGVRRQVVMAQRDLVLRSGQRLGLLGPTGGGKTTLARILLGLTPADSGRVERFPSVESSWTQDFGTASPRAGSPSGAPVRHPASALRSALRWLAGSNRSEAATLAPNELKRLWRRLQFAYQDTDLVFDPAGSIGESVAQVVRARHPTATAAEAWQAAAGLLERFELPPRVLDAPPRQVSGGERRRAAIARSLAALGFSPFAAPPPSGRHGEERVLILDEPTVGIDVFLQETLARTLLEAQSQLGLAYLVISHDRNFVSRFCDEVIEWRRPS